MKTPRMIDIYDMENNKIDGNLPIKSKKDTNDSYRIVIIRDEVMTKIKLKEWAEKNGISYLTANRHFHAEMIPGAFRLDSGTIL